MPLTKALPLSLLCVNVTCRITAGWELGSSTKRCTGLHTWGRDDKGGTGKSFLAASQPAPLSRLMTAASRLEAEISVCGFHRTIEVFGTFDIIESKPSCSSRVTQSRLPRTCPLRFWVGYKGGDTTTSVGNWLQCSTTVAVRKFFLVFSFNFMFCGLCPLPLVLPEGAAEVSPVPSSSFPSMRCTLIRAPWAFSRLNSPSSLSLSS